MCYCCSALCLSFSVSASPLTLSPCHKLQYWVGCGATVLDCGLSGVLGMFGQCYSTAGQRSASGPCEGLHVRSDLLSVSQIVCQKQLLNINSDIPGSPQDVVRWSPPCKKLLGIFSLGTSLPVTHFCVTKIMNIIPLMLQWSLCFYSPASASPTFTALQQNLGGGGHLKN